MNQKLENNGKHQQEKQTNIKNNHSSSNNNKSSFLNEANVESIKFTDDIDFIDNI